MTPRKPLFTFFGTASIVRFFFFQNTLQWISQNLTPTKEASFSPGLCFGLIDNISNLLLHHFLLIARNHIYTCRLRCTFPILEVYIQLFLHSMDIEKQIAFNNNTITFHQQKWAPFKYCSSERKYFFLSNQNRSWVFE